MTQKVMYVPLCVCVCVWSHIVNKLNEEKHNHTGLDFAGACVYVLQGWWMERKSGNHLHKTAEKENVCALTTPRCYLWRWNEVEDALKIVKKHDRETKCVCVNTSVCSSPRKASEKAKEVEKVWENKGKNESEWRRGRLTGQEGVRS